VDITSFSRPQAKCPVPPQKCTTAHLSITQTLNLILMKCHSQHCQEELICGWQTVTVSTYHKCHRQSDLEHSLLHTRKYGTDCMQPFDCVVSFKHQLKTVLFMKASLKSSVVFRLQLICVSIKRNTMPEFQATRRRTVSVNR